MVNYDEYLYPYWERPKSKRPPGAPLPPPSPPLTKLFNIDSIESPLKALELAKTQPYAFALPRSDDESRIPRTDDDAAPASALVSTNFSNAAEAITFLDSVCGGPNPRFSVSYELLAQDTPRKRSVLVTTKPTHLSIPDRTDAFLAFAPTLIGAFGGSPAAFAVSELVCGDGASSAFLLVENGPIILQTAGEHASFVSDLAASLGEAASAYVLSSPTEVLSLIGDVPYSVVPVCLNGLSGHRKMFNVLITSGPSGARTLLNVCKDPHGHLLTAGPRPSTGPELTFSGRLSYGLVSVSSIADQRDAIRWRRGLELLRIQLNTERITPESVMLASNAHGVGCFARWRNVNGGPCPLCNGRCAHVDLRLMRVAGLMASCKQCPAGSSPVVGPLYAPVFGFLATAAHKLNVGIIVDDIGVVRMAPTSDLEVPPGHVRLPSARPAGGKTYTAKHEYHATLERQIGQNKFYMIIVPFQVLAADYVTEMNKLFWSEATQDLIHAYRLQGYLPAQPEEGERSRAPYRHYEDVSAADFYSNGGHVITTCSSLHKFSPIYGHVDGYGRSKVGAVILDEGETAPYMMIDPMLVNNSSVTMNILNLFDVLRLSDAGVPVIWIDGFATDETSGACMRAAGVQFTELACPEVNAFKDVKVTHLRCYLRNQHAVKVNDGRRSEDKRVSLENTLKEYKLTLSVAGIIPQIIKSIEDRRNPQVLCSSKLMLRAIMSIVKAHFTEEPHPQDGEVTRDFYSITGDSTVSERETANYAAKGERGDPSRFGAIFTTSAVGGGLNFIITRVVFAIISRKLANAQEAWQTYLRSRNAEQIYVATYGTRDRWDKRLYDGFKAITGHAEWMVKDSHELEGGTPALESEDFEDDVVGADDVLEPGEFSEEDTDEPAAEQDGASTLADAVADARRAVEAQAYDEGVDPETLAVRQAAAAAATAALAAAEKAAKEAALSKGRKVALKLTRYHELVRMRALLGGLVSNTITDQLLKQYAAFTNALPNYSGGDVSTMQPKSFTWAGQRVVLVPSPARRVWTRDDQRGAFAPTWKLRSVFQKLHGSEEVTPASFTAANREAKRHKPAEYERLRQMAYELSKSHARIEAQRYADLPKVDELVLDLYARRRNASSAFFVTHEALREYMGFERTADIVSLDDVKVIEWNDKLNTALIDLCEAEMRDDLDFALTRLRLGQPQSLWRTAEARTAAIIQFQRRSEKKKSEMDPQSLRVLRLYKVQLAFGLGDRYWELWKAHLDAVDAAAIHKTVEMWDKLNGNEGRVRRTFRLVSELALEHADVGGDKGALLGFVWKETSKLAGKDDVYSVNGDPHKLLAAQAAAQIFGWSWLMDPAEFVINPSAPAVHQKVKTIAELTNQKLPKKQLTTATIRSVLNGAVGHLGVKISIGRVAQHSTTCPVKLESDLPDFLADAVAAHRLGYAPWNAFFSYSKHVCSCLCGEYPDKCPVNSPVEIVVPTMREELGDILTALCDPQRAVAPPPQDVELAKKLLATLDHTPEALLDEGRWTRHLARLRDSATLTTAGSPPRPRGAG